MPTNVIMPQMGESIFEGTITKWLKKLGEAVAKDEPLFEISTDKVDAEIPSPVAGVLDEIKFHEGETVQVNTVVAVIREGASASAEKAVALKTSSVAPTPAPAQPHAAPQPQSEARPSTMTDSGATEVVMPQMGESIFEGTIVKWLKRVGDTVTKDEPLFEISTDKVDAEIPSPAAGVLREIKFHEGETVLVNSVVAVIGGTGAAAPLAPAVNAEPTVAPQAAPRLEEQAARAQDGNRIRSSPLVRRIARENHIDLAQVQGTGSAKRVTKEDILDYLNRPAPKTAPAPPEVRQALPVLSGELVPMTKMRAIIAQRMSQSKRTIPHAHMVYKIDMTRIARLREQERAAYEQRNGVKLTYMPFLAVATIEALRRFPILNASLVDSSIQYHDHIELGVAVALEWGLIVPVIRQAETQSFVDLAKAISDLAGRARTKKLSPDEVGGSTFTLTNPGVFGGEYGTPIINPPESAILAIGSLRKEAVVLTDSEGNDTIAIRSVQYFCLGFDHRLIDGADAGKFMGQFQRVLETWDRAVG